MDSKSLSLKEKILVAAVEGTHGNCDLTFAMEDLVVWAWKREKQTWGLRGYEEIFPDSDKIQKELGSRGVGLKGVLDLGWLDRVGKRVYRLTSVGLATFAAFENVEQSLQQKAGRELEAEVTKILEHPVFRDWLKDNNKPKHFREAGHFWGIAPGTPKRTVRERVERIDKTLDAALRFLNDKNTNEIIASRGKILFERNDISRCKSFQETLRFRFSRDLSALDPSFWEMKSRGQSR